MNPVGDSKIGASNVGGTEGNDSARGGVIEGGSFKGGGNVATPVGEPIPIQMGMERMGGIFVQKVQDIRVK